ncbi:MAG TPA: cell division protein FtsA [Candidatus Saccharimonadales bacterium]|jgi:cell division protein FtsA|nr:cell division protein FtsA [Candidatus Saccharimonadales bacterium]
MHGSSASTPYVGLDVGTSTVRCVVGIIDQNNPSKLSIVAHGSAPNLGMRKGIVVHIEDVADAIAQAITEAERLSGMHLTGATVNINGNHVSGLNSKGVIAISAANREITQEDRLRVEEAATIVQLPSNREIIQVFAQNYRLDGQDNIKDPVGMHGVRLEVDTHIVTAATPNLRNLDMAFDKAQVNVHNRTLSSLAAAEAVLQRQQKEAGTVLIDIGAGTTNLVVLEDGEVQHVAVLPVGGQHITNDLAIGLRTDLDVAEAVKVQFATLAQTNKRDVRVKMNGQDHIFKAEDIAMITEARVEELFEIVNKELTKIHRAHKLPGGVVLVGGTAKLPGIAEFAKEQLQLASRVGKLQPMSGLIDTVADPAYCTAVGLMQLDMLLLPEVVPASHGKATDRTLHFVDSVIRRFKR